MLSFKLELTTLFQVHWGYDEVIKLVGLVIALAKGEMTAPLWDISHSCQAIRAGGQFYLHLGQEGLVLIRFSEMTTVCPYL